MKLIRVTTIPLSLDKLLGKQLSFMSKYFDLIAISADQKELKKVAAKYGVKHFHVEMTREITPLKDLIAVWKMYRYFLKEKPEIVHTHTPKAGLVGMMAAYFAKVPVRMHTVAGLPLLESTGFKRKILNLVETITYRFATKVYPNSYGLQNIILAEKFCSSRKLKVIGNGSSNGIDTDFFSPDSVTEDQKNELKKQLKISETDFVFIFVGRLVKDKGINELVSAFKNLQSQNLKLLLVGPFEQELDPLSKETMLEIDRNSRIISVGFQQDVRVYFAVSDALVFPSYREGFPNVVLQSLAMKIPAIVTDINGCNEIIVEGENGVIVPVKDEKSLEDAMSVFQNQKEKYFLLKENTIKSIEKYRQDVLWNSLLKEYQDLAH